MAAAAAGVASRGSPEEVVNEFCREGSGGLLCAGAVGQLGKAIGIAGLGARYLDLCIQFGAMGDRMDPGAPSGLGPEHVESWAGSAAAAAREAASKAKAATEARAAAIAAAEAAQACYTEQPVGGEAAAGFDGSPRGMVVEYFDMEQLTVFLGTEDLERNGLLQVYPRVIACTCTPYRALIVCSQTTAGLRRAGRPVTRDSLLPVDTHRHGTRAPGQCQPGMETTENSIRMLKMIFLRKVAPHRQNEFIL